MTLIEIKKNKFDVDIDLRYSKKIILQVKKYLWKISAI